MESVRSEGRGNQALHFFFFFGGERWRLRYRSTRSDLDKTVWSEIQELASLVSAVSTIPITPSSVGVFGDCPFEGARLEMRAHDYNKILWAN